MVAIEEKCGLNMSSYQDLPKSDCNGTSHHTQANDLDKSYVFVTGDDSLADGAVGDKDVVVGGSSVPLEPEGAQNEKIGAVSEEAHYMNERVNGNVELSNGHSNLVNNSTCKHESSHEDGEGVQLSVTDSPAVQTCNIESSPEAEVKQVIVAEPQEVHTEITKSVAEADVKQVVDSNGETESMSEAEVEKALDQNGEIEDVVEGQQEDLDGVTIVEPPPCPVENQESQVRALESVAEIGENGESNNIFLNSNSSNSPNDVEDQSNTSVTEALEAQQRPEDVVVDADEHELQSVGVEAGDEAKSTTEFPEHEVSRSTSMGSESFSINSKDKTLEEEAKTNLSLDVLENQQGDNGASNIVKDMVGETVESKSVGSCSDSHGQTTCGLVVEEKDEDSSVSEAENGSEYPEESQEQPDGCGASHDTEPSKTMTEASVQTQSNPAPNACAPQSGTEVSDVEEIGRVSSSPDVDPESQIIEEGVPGYDSVIRCSPDEAILESDCALDMVVPKKEIVFEGGDETHSETEVSSGKSKVGDSSPETLDVKLESDSDVHDSSVIIRGEKSDDVAVSCRTDISDSFNLDSDGAANIELEVDGVEDIGDKLDGAAGNSKENLSVQENKNTGNSQNEETSVASAGVSTTNMTGEEKSIKTTTKPFNFLIRTPRFDDENLREQIGLAKVLVDEKTKLRDAIQLQIQEKRVRHLSLNFPFNLISRMIHLSY